MSANSVTPTGSLLSSLNFEPSQTLRKPDALTITRFKDLSGVSVEQLNQRFSAVPTHTLDKLWDKTGLISSLFLAIVTTCIWATGRTHVGMFAALVSIAATYLLGKPVERVKLDNRVAEFFNGFVQEMLMARQWAEVAIETQFNKESKMNELEAAQRKVFDLADAYQKGPADKSTSAWFGFWSYGLNDVFKGAFNSEEGKEWRGAFITLKGYAIKIAQLDLAQIADPSVKKELEKIHNAANWMICGHGATGVKPYLECVASPEGNVTLKPWPLPKELQGYLPEPVAPKKVEEKKEQSQ